VREQVTPDRRAGHPRCPVDSVEQAATGGGACRRDQAAAIADDYGKAQLHGLERGDRAVAIFGCSRLVHPAGCPARAVMPTSPQEAGAPGGPRAAPR
jgi:hypothetical protein